MNQYELEQLFANAPGLITIREAGGGASMTSRDFNDLAQFAEIASRPILDLVTSEGNAVGLAVNSSDLSVPPFPGLLTSPPVFLSNGEKLTGQPPNQHYVSYFALTNWTVMPRHRLLGLRVQMTRWGDPEVLDLWDDSPCLRDRSVEERKHLLDLQSRCAVVFVANKLNIAWRPFPSGPIKFISVRDAQQREANRTVLVKAEGGGTKTLKMFDEWMKLPARRGYDEVKFSPGCTDPGVLNLFTGFPVEPVVGDWSIVRHHLRDVICDGSSDQFDWIMTYIAHIFQCPENKPPTALVIRGKKGNRQVDYLRLPTKVDARQFLQDRRRKARARELQRILRNRTVLANGRSILGGRSGF